MKSLLIGLLFVSSAAIAATAVDGGRTFQMRANQHSCGELQQAIRTHGKVLVLSASGVFGNVFYSSPHHCHYTYNPKSYNFRVKGGESCRLQWACEFDNERNR